MTTSRASYAERPRAAKVAGRGPELALLMLATLAVAAGLYLVYVAKTGTPLPGGHGAASAVDLNRLSGPYSLLPLLGMIPSTADQQFVAAQIYEASRRGQRFENAGALLRIRVTEEDIEKSHGLESFPRRLGELRKKRNSITLLTPTEFAQMKPSLVVRDLPAYRRAFLIWVSLYFACFYVVHIFWRARRFAGDNVMLPAVHALSGIGLVLMISLRDPVRDTLLFADFSQGVIAGCVALMIFSMLDYERSFSRLSYVPLVGALLLAIALGLFGTGPGTSDARVNLFFFQPVEIIRILLVLFLAGYFARNWDALRELKQGALPMPRLEYLLPVGVGVAFSLALFFWLSDLGPALIVGCLFLTLYSIARNRVGLASLGLAVIIAGFAIGHWTGHPHTVTERVGMWLSPWDNAIHGGDQLADSLWALATGGATGTGLGLGDPSTIPAGHTDLILSVLGEETGFAGVFCVYALYAVLLFRSLRVALRAPGAYSLFLTIGLALITAYQLLLISGGLLGLIPLSGVVSPFLSYGRTAMVANFALFGMILAISSRGGAKDHTPVFGGAVRVLRIALGVLFGIVVARAAYLQTWRADATLVRGTLVVQADGVRRYQYNPRLLSVAREISKGNIFDRNGLPLAASTREMVEAHRKEYEGLGISVDGTLGRAQRRYYPLGPPLFYLLGDVRTHLLQGASNTAFQEKESRIRLQGYDDVAEVVEMRDEATGKTTARLKHDYRALIPLLRHRYEPDNAAVKELTARNRDVRMSIHAGLELRAAKILQQHLTKLGRQKGALVVLDPATGDMLAAVSYPWPNELEFASLNSEMPENVNNADLLDRARYGLYPPGSSFKIVTAMAALRKDPALSKETFQCVRLPDGRSGNMVNKRAIRDDIKDKSPHGTVNMEKGITVSCNAYFAQLGTYRVGAKALFDMASSLGIKVASPDTSEKLAQFLPQASYGQGQVVASPFQMARVAATIANGGSAPQGRWVIDETNLRTRTAEPVLPAAMAAELGKYMREVVTSGTGRAANKSATPIAGKTGTAELSDAASHAWFIGYAPYGGVAGKQIAFAVLVENGEYGGTAAAPIAADLVAAARELGIVK